MTARSTTAEHLEGLILIADDGSEIDVAEVIGEQRATVLLPYRGTW